MTEIAADPFNALNEANKNFVSSLAAYSLMSYLFICSRTGTTATCSSTRTVT